MGEVIRTQVRGSQIADKSLQRVDIDISTSGQALITKLVPGAGITLESTGVDVGTGDVTISMPGYNHVQTVGSSVWNIVHGLNKFPSVVVVDSVGTEIEGDIRYVDSNGDISLNSVRLSFSEPLLGCAYLT